MKKSILRFFSLVLAVTLALSLSGVGTALAAAPAPLTVYVDSGNVTVFTNALGQLSVTANGVTKTTTTGLVIAQRAAGTSLVRSISVDGVYTGITLSGLNLTAPAGVPALSVTNSAVTFTAAGQNYLSGSTLAGVSVAAGSTATFASYANVLGVLGGVTANSMANNGTINVNSGALTVNSGGLGGVVNANGGTLKVSGNVGTLGGNGGAATVTNGAVTTANVKAGTLTAGAVTNLTVNGTGTATAGGVTNATVNGGTANVNGALTNATVTGGTLNYTNSAKLSAFTMRGGKFTASGSNVLPVNFTVTGGELVLTTKPTAQPKISTPYRVTKPRGTRLENLGLSTSTTATLVDGVSLGNKTEITVNIQWDPTNKYRPNSTGTQTITGTLEPAAPYKNAVTLSTTKVTAQVTLRSSSGGGGSSPTDPGYDYWMDVKSHIEGYDANTAQTITVSDKYDDMPTSVLEALKGTKITLVIERGSKGDIKIYGKNMKPIPNSQVFYKLADLAKLYKNSTSSSSSEPIIRPTPGSSVEPAPAPPPSSSQAPYKPPVGGGGVASSSSSSSEEESSSSEEEESSSSEEESSSSEEESSAEEVIGGEEVEPEPEKKGMSPIAIVAIVAAVVALAAGIVSYIVIRKRNDF